MKNFQTNQIVKLKDNEFLTRQKIAGKTVSECLKLAEKITQPGINVLEIESQLAQVIHNNKCTPTFFKYKGFPGKVCISINKELVHGIPRDYVIQDGDVVKIDLGATFDGAIADAARTFIAGTPKDKVHVQLVETCRIALTRGIGSIKLGGQVGAIGAAIARYVRDSSRFGLITNYGGHGIDENKPHASPFVPNKAEKNEGPRFQPGMTLAIEPMLTMSDNHTRVASDKWTVLTRDIGVHFEDTIFIEENGEVVVITK